jgi:hypothetical protein
VLVIGWIAYTGYTNVWQPAAIAAEAHEAAGESVEFGKELLKFLAQKDILDMLKTLLPILIPVYLFKRKKKMDDNVRQAGTNVKQNTNYVVREKMGIGDRRKNETPAQKAKLAKQYNRRTVDKTKTVKKVKK